MRAYRRSAALRARSSGQVDHLIALASTSTYHIARFSRRDDRTETVGTTVVEAPGKRKGAVIVREGVTRLLYAVNELLPGLGEWLLNPYSVVS